MKHWIKAVCLDHQEGIDFFISNPSCTAHYLSAYDKEIQAWLTEHINCNVKLILNDLQLDKLYDEGYVLDYSSPIKRIYKQKEL